MKKSIKIIIIVGLLLCFIYVYNIMVINRYDYIIVANNCNCQSFGNCKHTFVRENDEFREINKGFKKDKSNLYKIAIGTNTIAYFPYDIWYEMYKELRYKECSYCVEYENAINDYLPKYQYKKNDKQVFDKIVNFIIVCIYGLPIICVAAFPNLYGNKGISLFRK